MSEKHYQISPIELVQWAEPLFGFGVGRATGFSEKTIASYEAAASIRLPNALREYYLACGKASLNCALHEIFIPDKKAKLFKKRLTFSYDHIDEDLETFSKPGEEAGEDTRPAPGAVGRGDWQLSAVLVRKSGLLVRRHQSRRFGSAQPGSVLQRPGRCI